MKLTSSASTPFFPANLLKKAFDKYYPDVEFELFCEPFFAGGRPHWAFDNFRLAGAMSYEVYPLFYTQPSYGLEIAKHIDKASIKCVTYAVDAEIYPSVKRKKKYDVGFVGNMMPEDGREEFFKILHSKFNCFISSTTPTNKISAVLAACKVLINPQRFEEINIRFFEAMACGAQVVSYSPVLHLFAEEGKHYLTYKTPEEAVEKIDYLLKHDTIREQMAKDARKHVIANHTYKHRAQEMLNFL